MSFDVAIERRIGEKTSRVSFRSDARLTSVVGRSGAGKTTLLNCVAGLARPGSGHIAVDGRVLFDDAEGIDLSPERRRAGYVFQDDRLFPHMRVGANLAYGERHVDRCERWMSLDEAVEFLGIDHLLDRWPATLSGGEARRVAIGRALLAAPRFLLLDEPLVSLDAARVEEILAVIERIRDEVGIPILHVSHSESEVARLAGHVVRLEG